MQIITRLRAVLTTTSRIMAFAAGYGLLAAALLVSIDVLMRKVGVSPINGADELSGYALAVLFSWSCSYALLSGSHLRVDVLYRLLPVRARAWHDVAAAAAFLFLAIIFAAAVSGVYFESFSKLRLANTTLRTPLWIPQALWAFGFAVFLLSATVLFLETALHAAKGNDDEAIAALNPQTDPES